MMGKSFIQHVLFFLIFDIFDPYFQGRNYLRNILILLFIESYGNKDLFQMTQLIHTNNYLTTQNSPYHRYTVSSKSIQYESHQRQNSKFGVKQLRSNSHKKLNITSANPSCINHKNANDKIIIKKKTLYNKNLYPSANQYKNIHSQTMINQLSPKLSIKDIQSTQSSKYYHQNAYNPELISVQYINQLKQQFTTSLNYYIDSFKQGLQENNKKILQLQKKNQFINNELIEKEKRIKKLELCIYSLDIPSCNSKINIIENKLRIINEYIHKQGSDLDTKLQTIHKRTINYHSMKLSKLSKRINEFINKKQITLCRNQTDIKHLNSKVYQKIIELETIMIILYNGLKVIQDKSISQANSICKFQQISFQFEDPSYSFSEDYFFHPITLQNNVKFNQLKEIFNSKNDPIHCYLDCGGYLRYHDSGSFVFDRKGNLINSNLQQLDYFISCNLIKLDINFPSMAN